MDLDNKYLDLSHFYFILTPLTEEAMNRLYRYEIYDDNGVISDVFLTMDFYEDTFCFIEPRLFDYINASCNLFINMYEEEIIETEDLPKVLELTKDLIANSDEERFIAFAKEFQHLVEVAIEKNTCIGFCF
ncbi:hypothetical protein IJT93_00535 [bacterium]|nr:hypothetical protein [bacterium]